MSWYLSTIYSYFGVIECFIHLYFSASDDLRCPTLFVVSPCVLKQYCNLRSKMLWEQAMKDFKDAEADFSIVNVHLCKSAMSVMPWYRCWLSGVGCWWILVSVLMLLSRVTSDVPSEPCHHPLSPPHRHHLLFVRSLLSPSSLRLGSHCEHHFTSQLRKYAATALQYSTASRMVNTTRKAALWEVVLLCLCDRVYLIFSLSFLWVSADVSTSGNESTISIKSKVSRSS